MRGFVRALSSFAVFLPLLLQPHAALSQDRSLALTRGADYFGGDYDVRKDVDLGGCQAACIGDDRCLAFTYNESARWCFLKEGVGELRAVEGAISGRIVAAAEPRPDVEAQRVSELGFLDRSFVDEARRFAGRLADTPAMIVGRDAAIAAAQQASGNGDYLTALDRYADALRADDGDYDVWMDFTDTAVRASSDDWEVRQRLQGDRMNGSVNAYLRAVTPQERARTLQYLGWTLADRYEWKQAIRAYRASLALADAADVREIYDRLVAEHGFRIVDNTVEADAAAPRICLNFSDRLAAGRDYGDFVIVDGGNNLAVEGSGQQICIDGVEHGRRYRVTAREGIPAADGDTLQKSAALDIFVRDRAPSARFLGSAYVLPAGGDPTIPIVTVNTSRVNAALYRIGDRGLAAAIGDNTFLSALSPWEAESIEEKSGEKVWTGTVDVQSDLNREVTTAIPVGELQSALKPGAYVLTAQAVNDTGEDWAPKATQWFIVTDLGLSTLSGNDGLHAFVRSLGAAAPVGGVALKLVAVNNEVLGEATTDTRGYARFAPGLIRGTGGMAPGLLTATTAAGDFSFLDLSHAAMDLTDRGVEGRDPPKPLDVFLTTERGIYRAGETVHATTLVRDATANAVENAPLTAIVKRPDGKEHSRFALTDQGLGGNSTAIDLPASAMRGTWRVGVYTDVKASPLAETTFLVEDFQPERLDFDLTADQQELDPDAPGALSIDARFLYGAPASGLDVEGETVLKAARALDAFPGYSFGLSTESFDAAIEPFSGVSTDEQGHADVPIALPSVPSTSLPLTATINARVLDTSGSPVERSIDLPVAGAAERIGVKPLFDRAPENSNIAFEAIALGPDGARVSADGLRWSLYEIRTDFQWYRTDGRWDYETVETKTRLAGGTVDVPADRAARIEAAVKWGSYRLEIEGDGDILPVSTDFEAGWYVSAKALDTPEALKVSLDKERYAVGEQAKVHLETRFNGVALVMVVDDRLIATKTVEVNGDAADFTLDVTRDWGPGAYVTAALYRPMDIEAKRMPGRAIGLAWAGVDPGIRAIDVEIAAPDSMRPRQDMAVTLTLANLPANEKAYVTLAAVDLGILNLTRYETPDPEAYYFGQRRLGMAIRDLYGELIDRMQGVRGVVRSGGDGGLARFEGPPPTETLVAFHSGVVEAGPDGTATLSVPIPDFNGTIRLMAMAWTRAGVGHAERDVLVRDPVVVTSSLPAFLAPGDQSRLRLDLTAVEGLYGPVTLSVSSPGDAVSIQSGLFARDLDLAQNQRETVLVPITGEAIGDTAINVALSLPDGTALEKRVPVAVRLNEPPVTTTDFVTLAPGAELSVSADRLDGLVPGTASVQLSASGAGRLNVPAILRALDRYPYGCTEQITSRAMPLVYLNDVAIRAGLAGDTDIRGRVEKAIAGVLANQSASGSFGLWSPGSEDMWLDAYVSDFLTRARGKGYSVPAEAFDLALSNLKNRLAYAGDFTDGGEDVAYALYVLAANGRAAIGDLRYYAETKLADFGSPLAKAQIGAALALYGDKPRAERVFRSALGTLDTSATDRSGGYRSDYGSPLRDGAAMLTLASETRAGIDLVSLSGRVEAERLQAKYTSTQEDAWSLMAAHALMESLSEPRLVVDGEPLNGPLFRSLDADALDISPLTVANKGDRDVALGISVRGIPGTPEPAGGNFYTLTRSYFTLDGEPVDPGAVEQGARLVAVLNVTTTENQGARLVLDDPLPAGFEIDNPHILASGDVAALDWLKPVSNVAHTEFRSDRFIAAWDLGEGGATDFQFAYVLRATSPGTFLHPAALIEDMYRPERRARTDSGAVEVVGPLR